MSGTTTHPTSPEGLVVKYLEADNFIDFGDDSPRPSVEQLDEDLTRQIRVLVHGGHHHPSQSPDCEKQTLDNEPLYVRSLSSTFILLYTSFYRSSLRGTIQGIQSITQIHSNGRSLWPVVPSQS